MLDWSLKLLVSFIILVIALIGGVFPIIVKYNEETQHWLLYGEAFAGGIFLGVGLIHLLPEAHLLFHTICHQQYPLAFVICAFTILFLRIIEEQSEKKFQKSNFMQQSWLAYLLTLLLSIHSVLEGMALGVENAMPTFLMIFIAIIAHKGSAAFALGVNMRSSLLSRQMMFKLMVMFAFMTPLGILFGASLMALLHEQSGYIVEAIFNSIAAGTFIYIAAFHSVSAHCHCKHLSVSFRLLSFAVGLILMALIAIWL